MRWPCLLGLLGSALSVVAAEKMFEFRDTPKGEAPAQFQSMLTGEGSPGRWEVIRAAVPPRLAPLSPQAPRTAVEPVLTQTDRDPTDERFPMLVYQPETFGDFVFKTRLRVLGGEKEQMAGLVFRLQDKDNYYVARVSALGRNLRFYKVVAGLRGRLIGPTLPIQTNVWYELSVQCEGNQITCRLDGDLVMPPLQDSSFSTGRIGFWTKSDSDCQFAGAVVQYTPLVPLSAEVLEVALKAYPRVVDLRLYTLADEPDTTTVVAGKNPADVGSTGGKAELGAIRNADTYFGRGDHTVTVVMPVRDRNGDPVAAAQIVMDSFPGQTENNALVRARPIVKLMESRVELSTDPFR